MTTHNKPPRNDLEHIRKVFADPWPGRILGKRCSRAAHNISSGFQNRPVLIESSR